MIDNYDSFTYNLVQYLGELGAEVLTFRNDAITIEEIERLSPDRIVISPGPCTPLQAGISNEVIRRFAGRIPILGVCLGHQCIGHVFGARIVRAKRLMHGKTSMICHNGEEIFKGLENPFEATRYHSLIIDPGSLPPELEVTAWAEDDPEEIMVHTRRSFLKTSLGASALLSLPSTIRRTAFAAGSRSRSDSGLQRS